MESFKNIRLDNENTVFKKDPKRDLYGTRTFVLSGSLNYKEIEILVIVSEEYLTETLGYDSEDYNKIKIFLDKETEKVFEEYKNNPTNFSGTLILRQFSVFIANIDDLFKDEFVIINS
jgi:hypothetical protein